MDSSGNEESLTKELSHYYRDSLWAGKLTRCDFSDDRYHLTSYEGAGRLGSDDCDGGRYLDIAQECFDEVVDIAALDESLMEVGLSLDVNSEFVQICPARVSATRQIERLYQNIVRSKGQRRLSLYNDLLSVEPRERKIAEFPSKDLAHVMEHCGTMDRTYCLSPSQRRAMRCFLDGDERSTLAVSGPPGTGKTTLLKAMVADMLVPRALEGSGVDAPVIVGTSTNNQAVLNIIDTFGSVGREDDGLFRRWLPDPQAIGEDDATERAMGGIGCFLPSAACRQWAIDAGYYVSGSYGMDRVSVLSRCRLPRLRDTPVRHVCWR